MANNTRMTIDGFYLPTFIQKKFTGGTYSYTPADATEGWYCQVTNVLASQDKELIAGDSFIAKGSTTIGANSDAEAATVHADDIVKFLYIEHKSVKADGTTANTADSVYLTFDANASNATTDIDSIEIGPGETWFAKLNCKVSDLHALSGVKDRGSASGSEDTIQCLVAAIIDDVA
jgi:hypothetical protein